MEKNFFMNQIKIGNRFIGDGNKIFFIAEAGVNHNGSIKIGKQLIDAASEAGADAVKFQTFLAEEIIIPKGPKAKYHLETTGSNKALSWFDLLKSQEISREMHMELINHCKKKKITFMSTPYDKKSADLLSKMKIKAFKIASTDNDNYPFVEYLIKKNKPIILSTAMSSFKDVKHNFSLFKKHKFKKFAFLQCTANYPSSSIDANLKVIKLYKEKFKCPVGLSDHTMNNVSALTSVGLGANIIEKHFTTSKKLFGPDHRMSLSPNELFQSIREVREAENSLGKKIKYILPSEKQNKKKLKKSIVTISNVLKGEKLSINNISFKRPATGIRPRYLNKVLGKRVKKNLPKNTILKFSLLK